MDKTKSINQSILFHATRPIKHTYTRKHKETTRTIVTDRLNFTDRRKKNI